MPPDLKCGAYLYIIYAVKKNRSYDYVTAPRASSRFGAAVHAIAMATITEPGDSSYVSIYTTSSSREGSPGF